MTRSRRRRRTRNRPRNHTRTRTCHRRRCHPRSNGQKPRRRRCWTRGRGGGWRGVKRGRRVTRGVSGEGRRVVLRSCLERVGDGGGQHRRGGNGFTLPVANMEGREIYIHTTNCPTNAFDVLLDNLRIEQGQLICSALGNKPQFPVSDGLYSAQLRLSDNWYREFGQNHQNVYLLKCKHGIRNGIEHIYRNNENLTSHLKNVLKEYSDLLCACVETTRADIIPYKCNPTHNPMDPPDNVLKKIDNNSEWVVVDPAGAAFNPNTQTPTYTGDAMSGAIYNKYNMMDRTHNMKLSPTQAIWSEWNKTSPTTTPNIIHVFGPSSKENFFNNLNSTFQSLKTVLLQKQSSNEVHLALPLISAGIFKPTTLSLKDYMKQYITLIDKHLSEYKVHLQLWTEEEKSAWDNCGRNNRLLELVQSYTTIPNLINNPLIKHVGAFVYVTTPLSQNYKLLCRNVTGYPYDYDSFGGYNQLRSLPYMINALRLELFDEGNIIITEQNLIDASPLLVYEEVLLQIFILDETHIGTLYSWEDSGEHSTDDPCFGMKLPESQNGKIVTEIQLTQIHNMSWNPNTLITLNICQQFFEKMKQREYHRGQCSIISLDHMYRQWVDDINNNCKDLLYYTRAAWLPLSLDSQDACFK